MPGFPKAGTTSVCAALGSHPAVFAPYTKEPHHWATDLPFYARREGTFGRADYLSLYEPMTDEYAYGLDGSTLYLYSESAAAAIAATVPDPRFIVCLREIRSMIGAWHGQMLAGGYECFDSLAEAWDLSEARRRGDLVPDGCPDARLLDYQRIGAQGAQLERLLQHVPASSVLIVQMESLAADPQTTIDICLSFLALDRSDDVVVGTKNASFDVRYRWLRRLLYAPPIKRSINQVLNRLGPKVSSSLRDLARLGVYRRVDRKPAEQATLESIGAYFADDQRLLERLLQRVEVAGVSRPDTA